MTKPQRKKLVAPVVITALLILYMIGYAAVIVWIPGIAGIIKILIGVIPLSLTGVSIFVLVERIKEVRSGEEDDLSQY